MLVTALIREHGEKEMNRWNPLVNGYVFERLA